MIFNFPYADGDGKFFTGNLGDIEISDIDGDTVDIEASFVKHGRIEAKISEKYTKDEDGKVTLHDFRSIVEPLFDDLVKNGTATPMANQANVWILLVATDSSQTKEKTYYAVYSSGKLNHFPSSFTYFYTLVREKRVYRSAFQYLSAPSGLNIRAGLAYRKADGTPAWLTKTYPSHGSWINFNCETLPALLGDNGSIKPEACLYAEFELLNSDNSVADKVRFTFIEHGSEEEHDTFLFTNFFGYPETMTLKGFTSESIVMDSQLGWMDGALSKYDNDVIIENQAYTGNMGEEEYALFQDLIHSRSLFLMGCDKDGRLMSKRIVLTDVGGLRERHSKQIQSATINYRYAERYQRTAKLNYQEKPRIFDGTFNPSFE